MHDEIAKSTFYIESGESSGSGFHFMSEDIILTNAHVVESAINGLESVTATTETGTTVPLSVSRYSPKEKYDFAILEAMDDFQEDRHVLEPKTVDSDRGDEIIFSGFPHGIDDLLVHTAQVSGPYADYGFYIDGSVNGGNSGGPIVDSNDGKVISLVTERRYLTPVNMDEVIHNMYTLSQELKDGIGMDMVMSGISLTKVLELMGDGFVTFAQAMEANANAGIGIGYNIRFAEEGLKEMTSKSDE